MEWTMQELTIFCDIQTVAAITGLPIVISALKHFSKHPQQKIGKSTILTDIMQDDLERVGYAIDSEKTIENTINSLVQWRFLREDNDEIMLDDKGRKAIDILKLKNAEQI